MSYFAGRSGDLFVLQKPYWLMDSSAEGSKRSTRDTVTELLIIMINACRSC